MTRQVFSSEQILLLKASLYDDDRAVEAWRAWIDRIDIENLDKQSYFLLPILYRNLVAHGVEHPEMTRLKGVYRRHWYQNQLQLEKLNTILNTFQEADLKTIVFGDISLATHYKERETRQIQKIELLVSLDKVYLAIELLKKLGWHTGTRLNDKFLSFYTKIGFRDDSGQYLNIHWRLFGENVGDREIQEYGQDNDIYLLKPELEILNICWRAVIDNNFQLLDIADAIRIIPSHADRIAVLAGKYHLNYRYGQLMGILEGIFDRPIGVNNLQSSGIEKLELYLERTRGLPLNNPLSRKITYYARNLDRGEFPLNLEGWLKYLKINWGLTSSLQIPGTAIEKIIAYYGNARPK